MTKSLRLQSANDHVDLNFGERLRSPLFQTKAISRVGV